MNLKRAAHQMGASNPPSFSTALEGMKSGRRLLPFGFLSCLVVVPMNEKTNSLWRALVLPAVADDEGSYLTPPLWCEIILIISEIPR